jgi:hypothetical protein
VKKSNKNIMAEIAGWYGMIAIVSAYALVSFNILTANSIVFQLLNLTGSLGIIWISIVKGVNQSIVLNAFWALIAIVALVNILY